MLCTLSWTSFALKSQFIEARLASTITLVLALMALSQVITPSLPPEQTKAHNFMFTSRHNGQSDLELIHVSELLSRCAVSSKGRSASDTKLEAFLNGA